MLPCPKLKLSLSMYILEIILEIFNKQQDQVFGNILKFLFP